MKKFILGLTAIVAMNAMAAAPATGNSLTPVTPFTGTTNQIKNTVKIAGDAKSIN